MPIKGLTENPTIPRLGKIHLGTKRENGSPINQPYFVVPEEVAEVYGPEPTELKIVFLSDDMEKIASQYYRAYNASNGLVCRGDGERADALLDADALAQRGGDVTQPLPLNVWAHGNTAGRGGATANVVRHTIECPGAICPAFAAKKCAISAFFQFAIRDVPGLGVYQMDTGSVNSIKKLNGALEMARAVLGGVSGVPMIMRRVQQQVSPDGKAKKVWMVELIIDTEYSLTNLLQLRSGPVANALLPPVDETEIYEPIEDEEVEQDPPAEPYHKVYEGTVVKHGETQEGAESGDAITPPASPPAEPTPAPMVGQVSELLNAILKKYGAQAAATARGIMPRAFDTMNVERLTVPMLVDYIDILRFRLAGTQHEHDLAVAATGRPICRSCGDEMEEPAGSAAAGNQGALIAN